MVNIYFKRLEGGIFEINEQNCWTITFIVEPWSAYQLKVLYVKAVYAKPNDKCKLVSSLFIIRRRDAILHTKAFALG